MPDKPEVPVLTTGITTPQIVIIVSGEVKVTSDNPQVIIERKT